MTQSSAWKLALSLSFKNSMKELILCVKEQTTEYESAFLKQMLKTNFGVFFHISVQITVNAIKNAHKGGTKC